jgi:hypothetical protein
MENYRGSQLSQSTRNSFVKRGLGWLPYSAELYQTLFANGQIPSGGYSLGRLKASLPEWVAAARSARNDTQARSGKKVFIVGYMRWWLEYSVALSLLLYGLGYDPYLGFLPYRRWTEPVTEFDRRRQSTYIRRILRPMQSLIDLHDLSSASISRVPTELQGEMQIQSMRDLQYILQREDLNPKDDPDQKALYDLRMNRNLTAAMRAKDIFTRLRPDTVIIPNGSILEFGSVYRMARQLDLQSSTFEFGEQRDRMWLSQNSEVMRQDTSDLWRARGSASLTDQQKEKLEQLNRARRGALEWDRFRRKWQSRESVGVQAIREQLGLDRGRTTVLICTNVVGDSLALERQTFTDGMADWLTLTLRHLAEKADVQLVVRVHPGELLGAGHPSAEIVETALPSLPDNVVLVEPDSHINTYDLIDIAQVGLVYTTTVGLEMAMSGLPVVVAGDTHYRHKGFTHDPQDRDQYLSTLDDVLAAPEDARLDDNQIETAWHYASLFFFEYPFPFPWHIVDFWDDVESIPPSKLLQQGAMNSYMSTVRALVGEPIDWHSRPADA